MNSPAGKFRVVGGTGTAGSARGEPSHGAAPEHGPLEHLASNLYFDRLFASPAVKVLPGEYYVTQRDMVLVTVLGSCVTACVRDVDSGIGGMNHFMLPEDGGRGVSSVSARYGTFAMEVLINHLQKLGARRGRLEAKVFGGGAVLESLVSSKVGGAQCRVCSGLSEDRENSDCCQGFARLLSTQGLFLPAKWPGDGAQVTPGT
jgi:chemotaxis receptor (MCP) glutamine deamidase CheD